MSLDAGTRAAILAAGHDPERIGAAIERLLHPATATHLNRPATVGDGILSLSDALSQAAERAYDDAAAQGRVSCFVPASGAASRMVATLKDAWSTGKRDLDASWGTAEDARRVVRYAEALAIWPELAQHGARPHDAGAILDAMFGPKGMALDKRPKGLVTFHRSDDAPRTAIAEHLHETRALVPHGPVRLHVTVSDVHQAAFEEAVQAEGVDVSVDFSTQDPSTDMPSLQDGAPARDEEGTLRFRPGGHGALLKNLGAVAGDVVLLKNIDNVVPDVGRDAVLTWRRRLAGLLALVQGEAHAHVRTLRQGAPTADARAFAARWLQVMLPDDSAAVIARLDRPWRVCGMVPNDGQPGGGPFWAVAHGEVSLQIVESSQVDGTNAKQREILHASTHFNPVELALGLRDADGRPHDLAAYVDPDASIITDRTQGGHRLRYIEHPGLWNGSMAGWNTLFVEVPPETFAPVKALSDLLHAAHGGPL
jgi:hypothetical protein